MKVQKAREEKRNKKRNRYIFRISMLAIMIFSTAFAVYSYHKPEAAAYRVGDEAPDFKLKQINEQINAESIQLSDLKGKGVMINFWDTSCSPCENEIPYLEEVYSAYQDKGIEFLAVSLDINSFVVQNFTNDYGLSFPIVQDNKEQVKNLYKIGSLPTKVFIDQDGKVVDSIKKGLDANELRSYLDQIIPN